MPRGKKLNLWPTQRRFINSKRIGWNHEGSVTFLVVGVVSETGVRMACARDRLPSGGSHLLGLNALLESWQRVSRTRRPHRLNRSDGGRLSRRRSIWLTYLPLKSVWVWTSELLLIIIPFTAVVIFTENNSILKNREKSKSSSFQLKISLWRRQNKY